VDPTPSQASRPLGWWLKEADARIDAAFDRALGARGLDRRRWQVLATVARGSSTQHDVAAALSRFDSDAEIATIVADLLERGMVRRGGDDQLEITDRGMLAHEQAAREVDVIRTRVATALGHDGYEELIGLLVRLVEAFPDSPSSNGS
jgi:hypothetical protein